MRLSLRRLAAAYLDAARAVQPAERPKVARALITYVKRRRLSRMLPRLLSEASRLHDERRGKLPIRITTARPLDSATIRQAVGSEVEVTTAVDPDLIGGAVIERGDTRYDGSVRGRLRQLRQHLRQATF